MSAVSFFGFWLLVMFYYWSGNFFSNLAASMKEQKLINEREYYPNPDYIPPTTLSPRQRAKQRQERAKQIQENTIMAKQRASARTAMIQKQRIAKKSRKSKSNPIVKGSKPKSSPIVKDAISCMVGLGLSRSDANTLVNKMYSSEISSCEDLVSKCFLAMKS